MYKTDITLNTPIKASKSDFKKSLIEISTPHDFNVSPCFLAYKQYEPNEVINMNTPFANDHSAQILVVCCGKNSVVKYPYPLWKINDILKNANAQLAIVKIQKHIFPILLGAGFNCLLASAFKLEKNLVFVKFAIVNTQIDNAPNNPKIEARE